MSEQLEQGNKIIVKRRLRTGHRGLKTPTTINISLEAHVTIKKLRDDTGWTYSEIIALALEHLAKRIEVTP